VIDASGHLFSIRDQCRWPLWLVAILNHLINLVFSLYCELKSIKSIERMDETFPFTIIMNPAKMTEI